MTHIRAGHRLSRRLAAAVTIVAAGASTAAIQPKQDLQKTILVGRATGANGNPANRNSFETSISPTGRFVAFMSQARNLVPEDVTANENIFVRDRQDGKTLLVSRNSAGAPANASSANPKMAGDGRHVAFESTAGNLLTDRPGGGIFVHDLETRQTSWGGPGSQASISFTGRYVAFASRANYDGAIGGFSKVYVRDTQTDQIRLVSAGAELSESSRPSISGDGTYVAFQTDGSLVPEDTNEVTDVYRRDLATNTTVLVSRRNGAGGEPLGFSANPSISASGDRVVFDGPGGSFSDMPALQRQVLVRKLSSGSTAVASRASGSSGAGAQLGAVGATISTGGRYVVFVSESDNLTADDNNTFSNVFRRDLQSGKTKLVSRRTGENGAGANGDSLAASIGNGRYVAFQSHADNLSSLDRNEYRNIFVRDFGP